MLERDLLIGPGRGHSDVDVERGQSQHDVRFPVHAKALLDDIVATLFGTDKNFCAHLDGIKFRRLDTLLYHSPPVMVRYSPTEFCEIIGGPSR